MIENKYTKIINGKTNITRKNKILDTYLNNIVKRQMGTLDIEDTGIYQTDNQFYLNNIFFKLDNPIPNIEKIGKNYLNNNGESTNIDGLDINNNGDGSLSIEGTATSSYEETEGTSFTLTDADSTKQASITELKGNTTQKQEQGNNLFFEDYYKNLTYTTGSFYSYVKLDITGGRYLVIQASLKSGKTAVSGAYLNISSGYGKPASISAGETITGISNGTALTRSVTFTATELYLNIGGVSISDIFDNYNIMVATSNIPYEPYKTTPTPINPSNISTVSGDNEVVVSNKNLFDIYTAIDRPSWNNKICDRTITDANNFTLKSNATDDWCGIYLENLDITKNYIIKFTATLLEGVEGNSLYVGTADTNSPRTAIYTNTPKEVEYSFTNSSKIYIKIVSQTRVQFSNVQLEERNASNNLPSTSR